MSVRVMEGDCRERLRELEPGSVQLAVTSPPYHALRDYKHADQIGLEATIEEYIASLVEVFRLVRRALHPTGILALNLGDSYAGSGKGRNASGEHAASCGDKQRTNRGTTEGVLLPPPNDDLPAGSLLGVPWRVAFALQADGWLLRSAMTLIKQSPMPESVQGCRWERCRVKVAEGESPARNLKPEERRGLGLPVSAFPATAEWSPCPGCSRCSETNGLVLRWGSGRPTSATEMLFVLAKGPGYFWNSEGVRVASLSDSEDGRRGNGAGYRFKDTAPVTHMGVPFSGANARNWLVWRPEPLKEPHYAAFGTWLPDWAIRAATPVSVCPACRAPYAPVVERESFSTPVEERYGRVGHNGQPPQQSGWFWTPPKRSGVLSWLPTCSCGAGDGVPAQVLDPFAGSGTTGLAADRLGRDAVLIELNPEYADLCRRRVTKDAGLFAELLP